MGDQTGPVGSPAPMAGGPSHIHGVSDAAIRRDLVVLWGALTVVVALTSAGFILLKVGSPAAAGGLFLWILVESNALGWMFQTNQLPRARRLSGLPAGGRLLSSLVAVVAAGLAAHVMADPLGWDPAAIGITVVGRVGLLCIALVWTYRPEEFDALGMVDLGRKGLLALFLAAVLLFATASPTILSAMERADVPAAPTAGEQPAPTATTTTVPAPHGPDAAPAKPEDGDSTFTG